MHLLSLSLEHFRSYQSAALRFENDVQLFLGSNGSGKTNLLEAIAMLSLTKSFRSREDLDLVHWGDDFLRVTGDAVTDAGEPVRLEVTSVLSPRRQKGLFRNDVRVSTGQIVGLLPTVTFLPQDLSLFSGPPGERRRFLDQLLCQVSPEFLTVSAGYQKVLQQRNALLKRIARAEASSDDLLLWDRQLSARGSALTAARLELIETLTLTFQRELECLGEQWDDVQLVYSRKGTARERSAMEEELMALLLQNRERDILLQSTTVGPHREDWQVTCSGRALPGFASRGQERTAVLALLFLQVSYMELRRGEKPLILLDDVFSELDDAHQFALLSNLGGYQVFLTTTHLPPALGALSLWEVTKGSVEPMRQMPVGHRK